MGILNRLANLFWTPRETRSAESPQSFAEIFGYGGSSTGETITADTALTTSAFFAGVNIIASACAMMPFKVYKKTAEGREAVTDHAAYRLLHTRPNVEQTPFAFLWFLFASAIIWGTGLAEIQRNGRGEAIALWPIHPSRVEWKRIGGRIKWLIRGDAGQPGATIDDANILRVYVFSKNGISGCGLLEVMAETIGIQLASDKYLASYLANSATPNGLFEAAENITPEQMDRLRASWSRIHAGAKKSGRLGVLPPGVKYHQVGLDPKSSQLIEGRKATIGDYARFLNLPLSRLRNLDRATWGNYEQETLSLHTETLAPWNTALEQEASFKLFSAAEQRGGMYVRALFNAILRADAAGRTAHYTAMLDRGVYSINEVRGFEEMNGIGPAGDKHRAQMQMVDIGDRSEEDQAREHLGFLREIVKGLIADGTISDVLFNRMAIEELLAQVNVPVDPNAPEVPWLPVIADNGDLVSGDVILDNAGDVVGGDVVDPAAGEQPTEAPPPPADPPPADPPDSERKRRAALRKAAGEVLTPLVRDVAGRVVTRTCDRLRRAARKGADAAGLADVLRDNRQPVADALTPIGQAFARMARESRGREMGRAIAAWQSEVHAEIEALAFGDDPAARWTERFCTLINAALE